MELVSRYCCPHCSQAHQAEVGQVGRAGSKSSFHRGPSTARMDVLSKVCEAACVLLSIWLSFSFCSLGECRERHEHEKKTDVTGYGSISSQSCRRSSPSLFAPS